MLLFIQSDLDNQSLIISNFSVEFLLENSCLSSLSSCNIQSNKHNTVNKVSWNSIFWDKLAVS